MGGGYPITDGLRKYIFDTILKLTIIYAAKLIRKNFVVVPLFDYNSALCNIHVWIATESMLNIHQQQQQQHPIFIRYSSDQFFPAAPRPSSQFIYVHWWRILFI